jgi:hypothetical protein
MPNAVTSTAELLCLTNGVAIAAERRPEETNRLLSLLIEGLQHQVNGSRTSADSCQEPVSGEPGTAQK